MGFFDVSEEHSAPIFRVRVNVLFYRILHNFRKSVAFEGSVRPSDNITIRMMMMMIMSVELRWKDTDRKKKPTY